MRLCALVAFGYLVAMTAFPIHGNAVPARYADDKLGKHPATLRKQVWHSENVLRFFSNRTWMAAPRRHTCHSLPSEAWANVCLEARQQVRAHRWLKREASERLATFGPPIRYLAAWTCIHRYEGAWNANTGNGYYGGLQMDMSFQRAYGPELLARKGTANNWTPKEQIIVAERAHRTRGFHPWPNTARMCGLL